VRGGGEMGRHWYDEAKYLNKKNSFRDFVDVARWLTSKSAPAKGGFVKNRQGITSPSKLSIEGRSAGGLLIAAAINQSPDLFQAAILEVPFVDVLCTLIDTTFPERYFEYIKSYSPMNNVRYGHACPAC
jgi:oligopeptidase B